MYGAKGRTKSITQSATKYSNYLLSRLQNNRGCLKTDFEDTKYHSTWTETHNRENI